MAEIYYAERSRVVWVGAMSTSEIASAMLLMPREAASALAAWLSSTGGWRRLFAFLGDPRCADGISPSIAKLCGSSIGAAFEPPPAVCAAAATVLISVAPLLFLPFLPAAPSPTSAGLGAAQPVLLCFACGGMLGDVFLHILPHTLGGHGHGE